MLNFQKNAISRSRFLVIKNSKLNVYYLEGKCQILGERFCYVFVLTELVGGKGGRGGEG